MDQLLNLSSSLESYFDELVQVLKFLPRQAITNVVSICDTVRCRGGTIYVCGNGGSAVTASHFVADLNKVAYVPGQKRFKILALSDNTATLTAYANDEGYSRVFAGQMDGLATPDDLLIGISTSGRSANVVAAFELVRRIGMTSIAVTRDGDTPLRRVASDVIAVMPARIQVLEDAHMSVLHAISVMLRVRMEPSGEKEWAEAVAAMSPAIGKGNRQC